jgi:hypothetical protein
VERAIERELLAAAKARLDRLDLYRRPVALRRSVRIIVVPWLFGLPWFRRFDGYTMWDLILLRESPASADVDDRKRAADLVCHELCHVWQMQRHPLRMPLSYLVRGYSSNPYEIQARAAAELTGAEAAP